MLTLCREELTPLEYKQIERYARWHKSDHEYVAFWCGFGDGQDGSARPKSLTPIQVRAWERGVEAAKLVDPTRPRRRCHTVVAGGRDVRTGFSTPMAAWRWCEKNYSKEEIERLLVEVRGDTKIPTGVPYRTPDCAECDYIWDRDLSEGLQELIEKLSKPSREKIVGLLHARSRYLAAQPRLVVNNTE